MKTLKINHFAGQEGINCPISLSTSA